MQDHQFTIQALVSPSAVNRLTSGLVGVLIPGDFSRRKGGTLILRLLGWIVIPLIIAGCAGNPMIPLGSASGSLYNSLYGHPATPSSGYSATTSQRTQCYQTPMGFDCRTYPSSAMTAPQVSQCWQTPMGYECRNSAVRTVTQCTNGYNGSMSCRTHTY